MNDKRYRLPLAAMALALALGVAHPGLAGAAVIGFLGNFDVINDTGQTAHGFEIDLEGLHSSDITDTFGGVGRGFPSGRGFDPATAVQRYGAPTIQEYSDPSGNFLGTRVVYEGLWNGSLWDFGTPSVGNGVFATPGDNCWTGGGLGYGPGTPCDHFGVGTVRNATKTTYNWLVESNTPGTLSNGQATLPAPVWHVNPAPPPVVPPDPALPPPPPPPPMVGAQVKAPDPVNGQEFGTALWVKVFTTELDRPVKLEELIGGNPVVEQAQTEIEWQLLQVDKANPLSGLIESDKQAGANAQSVIRRYEFFAYGGLYDPQTHEALLANLGVLDPNGKPYGDSNPFATDIGTYLGAQNGAANLVEAPSPIPLPASVWLLSPALAALMRRRRRIG